MEYKIDETLMSCLQIPGQSGFEIPIRKFLMKKLANYGEISRDNLGSIICKMKGTRPEGGKWFISAHMDTCGFLVHSINGSGQVKCVNFGYQSTDACHLQPVAISTSKGAVHGVMYAKKENKDKSSFIIDIGVVSPKEAKDLGIIAGDPVHFTINPFLIGNPTKQIICSPRLDNRMGIFELLLLAEQLNRNPPPTGDVYLVATVEEEAGGRGAKTAVSKINPDYSIILDVTYHEHPVTMGQGPVITLADKAVLLAPNVRDFLMGLAREHQIPIQTEVWNIGATDAMSVRTFNHGVPTIPVLTATKNNHTPIEIGCVDDCYSTVKLCQKILENSDQVLGVFQM